MVDPDGRMSDEEIAKQEKITQEKLNEIINSPEKYTITAFVRKPFAAHPFNRGEKAKHSFYIIENNETGEIITLSYNGTKDTNVESRGLWLVNSETDQKSISSTKMKQKWQVEEIKTRFGIDVKKTAENILNFIEKGNNKYYALDNFNGFDKADAYNCNTALLKTIASVIQSSRQHPRPRQ